jgi:hypothetical protein
MKRKIMALVVVLALIATTITMATALTPPVAGSTPISTRAQLDQIRNNPNADFHLTANIDLLSLPWTPIDGFSGTFDGQGFIIYNMMIVGDHLNAGLFARLSDSAEIKNLGIEGSITISSTATREATTVGGIVGDGNGRTITNCFSNVEIAASAAFHIYAGGIVGANATVNNCFNTGNISATSNVNNNHNSAIAGGIGGFNVTATNSFNRGNLTANTNNTGNGTANAGGIVGQGGTATNTYNAGDIRANANNAPARSHFGAIVTDGTANTSFWNIDNAQIRGANSTLATADKRGVSSRGTATNVNSLTTGAMRNQSSFTNWDFVNIWTFDDTNYGFPVLRSASIFTENINAILPDIPVADGAPSSCSCTLKMLAVERRPEISDALQILRFVIGLSNVIDGTAS